MGLRFSKNANPLLASSVAQLNLAREASNPRPFTICHLPACRKEGFWNLFMFFI
jgi:hypothetical protein